MDRDAASRTKYLMIAFGLLVIGVIALMSIGIVALTFAIAMLALYRVRRRPTVFRPVMTGVAAFWLGVIPVMPWHCSTEQIGTTDRLRAVDCMSLTGIHYPDGNVLPALAVGVVAAVAAGAVSLAVNRRREHA
jgi:hypothetical protein